MSDIQCAQKSLLERKKLWLPTIVFVLVAAPNFSNLAFAFNYDTNYPVTETDNTGYASMNDSATGVSVTITNSN